MTGPQQAPAKQVVGFHVEGASPSPTAPSLLNTMTAGSPTPVIIPPTFQRETSHGSRSQGIADAAARALEATGSGAAPTAQAAPEASGASGSRAAAAAPPSTSAPRPIQAAEKAEASHAGLVKMASQASVGSEASVSTASAGMFSIDTSTVRQTPSPQPSPFAGHSKQAADGAADKGAAGGAAGPASTGGPPDGAKGPKPQREMTKAERRALQESQRAAKAAQKGGPSAPAPPAPKGGAGSADAARASKGGGSVAGGTAEPRPSGAKPAAATGGAAPRADADRRVDSAGGAGAAGGAGGAGSAAGAPSSAAAGGAGGADGGAGVVKKKKDPKAVSLNSTELFAHLQQFKRINVGNLLQQPAAANIHPAILQLGLRYADGSIRGANARCLAMLNAFCQMIRDYSTPDGKELSRDLLRHLSEHVAFLVVCRPLSVGMGNAIRHLKLRISTIPPDMPEAEAKELLEQEIADYVNVRIDSADKQLVGYAVAKVEPHGDVILTYAASHVVCRALTEAARAGKSFRVVVMDSRPEAEGRATLGRLLAAGIPCTYVDLNAASYIIREVTKVFLGAAAVLSNGTVLSRAGTAAVAMMAHAHNKPVMICCETHKFNERVQLDSITHNELGDPEALAAVPGKPEMNALEGWRDNPRLRLLNLKYDVMPAEYVTMVVTEFGMVPPTSVPVILREFRQSETTVSGPF
ncbi:hypothetical protein HXX76_009982 [Chlamydomonas incerta]|uniref:Translation initiation factor eIF2B subunit delta n=1 Tax=Chlamydomonas incerta TaxID=51695 RepID=A0A835SYA0_CHLIN|nr:hypothetical protein HXX76_009982 [Chlamydomonas incerta]|eukprot:KAG2430459.1 hypothetical protein HXX76_009982 [Chlamydomonas incerta]